MSLWNRFGHVALYDDTAVKNRYRMPIGVMAVIDHDYRTRIVVQFITSDTTTETFVWALECALKSRRGKQPDIFIQDADAAMTGAVRQVFPDSQPRRCLWHLYQNIIKNLSKVLRDKMNVSVDLAIAQRREISEDWCNISLVIRRSLFKNCLYFSSMARILLASSVTLNSATFLVFHRVSWTSSKLFASSYQRRSSRPSSSP